MEFTINVDRSVRAGYVSPESLWELVEGLADASPLYRAPELLRAHFLVLGCVETDQANA